MICEQCSSPRSEEIRTERVPGQPPGWTCRCGYWNVVPPEKGIPSALEIKALLGDIRQRARGALKRRPPVSRPMLQLALDGILQLVDEAIGQQDEPLQTEQRTSPFRTFELTMTVFLPEGSRLPDSFAEWIQVANVCGPGASGTRLERIVEIRYPLADDVVDKRKEAGERRRRWSSNINSPWE